jgi:type IV pilus biogenesis protein CpaD/CtpE
MNTRSNKLGAGLAMLAAVLAGCAPVAPRWESNFGNSVRATVAAQVADPAAARNANPVVGIDGRAAEHAEERYLRSFAVPTVQEPAMLSGRGK